MAWQEDNAEVFARWHVLESLPFLLYQNLESVCHPETYIGAIDTLIMYLGPRHHETLEGLRNVAKMFARKGNGLEAEKLFYRVFEIRERDFGPGHRDTLQSLRDLYRSFDHDDAAGSALLRWVLGRREYSLGVNHPAALEIRHEFALFRKDHDHQYPENEKLFRNVISMKEPALGPEDPYILRLKNNLAAILREMGNMRDAGQLFREVLEGRRRKLGERHPDTIKSAYLIAELLYVCGDSVEAEVHAQLAFRWLDEPHACRYVWKDMVITLLDKIRSKEEPRREK